MDQQLDQSSQRAKCEQAKKPNGEYIPSKKMKKIEWKNVSLSTLPDAIDFKD